MNLTINPGVMGLSPFRPLSEPHLLYSLIPNRPHLPHRVIRPGAARIHVLVSTYDAPNLLPIAEGVGLPSDDDVMAPLLKQIMNLKTSRLEGLLREPDL